MSTRPTEETTRPRLTRPAATPAPASQAAPEAQRNDPISRFRRWIDGIGTEIRKVTWPSRLETRNLTIVVIGISVAVGAILGLVDAVLTALVQALTGTAV